MSKMLFADESAAVTSLDGGGSNNWSWGLADATEKLVK